MRIIELLEGKMYELDELSTEKDKHGLDFDLAEDVAFFMNHDDNTYRRYVYPAVVKCVRKIKSSEKIDPLCFETAAKESYQNYIQKYQIRQLPETLDEDVTKSICEKFYDELCKAVEEGKYN